jgi:Protein of unknown function (DUF3563)
MSSLRHFLKTLFGGVPSRKEADDAYLAGSVDFVDLERRMRRLEQRGRYATPGLIFCLYDR